MPNVEKVRAKRQAFFEKNAAVIGETFIAEKSWRKTTQKTKLPDLLVGYVLARLNPGTVKTKIILEWVANDTKD